MTRDDVVRIAREAGDDVEHTLPSDLDFLERFAALVATAEREACAKVCDAMSGSDFLPHQCAAAIRTRGNQ